MIVSTMPEDQRPLSCLPLPAVLVRSGVLVIVYVFLLVLLRAGYDALTSLSLVSGLSLVAVRTGHGLSRPLRAWPMIRFAR
ncbi:hypothetical protein ACFXGA_18680 [Actinosynnema sp. NPDC059335]|uniref:hypothetical protein n=1 Tax=Actinosynnema sp. NPDC059335 TaxID=3346804 RepID=UPI00366A6118